MAALRDIGWNVEPEAYEEFQLQPAVTSGRVSPRVATPDTPLRSLDGDVLLPQLVIMPGGRVVKFESGNRALPK